MLDVVEGLQSADLSQPALFVSDQPTDASILADILRWEVVDAGQVAPVIVLIDLPEPSIALAGLQNVLGSDDNSVYLLSLMADERRRAEVHTSSKPALQNPHSACFADTWQRIVQALRFVERSPDILVVQDVDRAVAACAQLMQELALSAPIRVMITMSNDSSDIRRNKKFLSGSMETITRHDACTVLRARRQVL